MQRGAVIAWRGYRQRRERNHSATPPPRFMPGVAMFEPRAWNFAGCPRSLDPHRPPNAPRPARGLQRRQPNYAADDSQPRWRAEGLPLRVTGRAQWLREAGLAPWPRRRQRERALRVRPEPAAPPTSEAVDWHSGQSAATAAGGRLVLVPL